MPSRPRAHIQETSYSCAPACLLMILESYGIYRSEAELRILCDCLAVPGSEGTYALSVVDTARALGLVNSRKYTMDFNGLRTELRRGVFPMVYIYTRVFPDQALQQHAVVVIQANESSVHVNDPLRGEFVLS